MIKCICLFMVFLGFARADEPLKLQESSSVIQDAQEEMLKLTFIPYAQIEAIFPGGGASLRAQKELFGIQLDARASSRQLYSSKQSLYAVTSISPLIYPFSKSNPRWSQGGWNMGLGLGVDYNEDWGYGWRSSLVLPFSMGYQGKWIFLDASVDLVQIAIYWPQVFDDLETFPTLKLGLCF